MSYKTNFALFYFELRDKKVKFAPKKSNKY